MGERIVGRLAKAPWRQGDELPEVGTLVLVSGANCDVESDQHRSYGWRRVVGYGDGDGFVCLQTEGCWPTVERMENCWFAEIKQPKATHPQPVTPAGGEVVAYRYVADEGVYNPFVRDWLDGSPDRIDLENIARHPGVRFEFAYSNPPVADHELQQKWFRRGWDMYVELHGETHPPVADAALLAAAKKVNALYPLHWDRTDGAAVVMPERVSQMEEAFAELDAALNQRGGGTCV